MTTTATTTARLGLTRMLPRDAGEPHRAASPLELFFDLVFVVAVSFASVELHHLESDGHVGEGVLAYLLVFFAIWWAWMNFTWFATAFDTDDWLYRELALVQMAGVLVLAAGTPDAMLEQDFGLATLGYVVMRLPLVAQWLRAAASSPDYRTVALRYAAGILVVQCLWVARLALPEGPGLVAFLVLVVAELSVPVIAERDHPTPWHPSHVVERYGLFVLILLGESILASANAVVDALEDAENLAPLLVIAAAAMVMAAAMWWLYFSRENAERIDGMRHALVFGYGHYVVFAAAGAFSAGVEVLIDAATDHTELSTVAAQATLTVPVGLFVLGVWWLTLRHALGPAANAGVAGLGVLVAASALLPGAPVVAAVLLVASVVVATRGARREPVPA